MRSGPLATRCYRITSQPKAGTVLLIGWVGDEIGIWNEAQVAAWLLSYLAKNLGGD